jgi:hypothetical protein
VPLAVLRLRMPSPSPKLAAGPRAAGSGGLPFRSSYRHSKDYHVQIRARIGAPRSFAAAV